MEPTTTFKVLMFWLAVTCIVAAAAAVVPLGSAEETQDLAGCIGSLVSVEGCVKAIDDALKHKVFDGLKHKCCTAIVQLGDNCWPILFPGERNVPMFLKAVCNLIGEAVAPTPH